MKNKGEIIIYQSEGGNTKVDVRLHEEMMWLTLNQLADLFQRDKSVISPLAPPLKTEIIKNTNAGISTLW